jgi:hypothetical protein
MAFFVSPKVKFREVDLTNLIPGVAVSDAAFVGEYSWGPVDEAVLIDSEASLVRNFSTPVKSNERNSRCFHTAASFLAYGNHLYNVRVVDVDSALNSTAGDSGGELVKNDTHYESGTITYPGSTKFVAKYPGSLGNSLAISLCGDDEAFSKTYTGINYTAAATVVTVDGAATQAIANGSVLVAPNGEERLITDVTDAATDTVTIESAFSYAESLTGVDMIIKWRYHDDFGVAPGTSTYATDHSFVDDEMHIAIIDEDGVWTGAAGTILEKFAFVSKFPNAKTEENDSNYYKDVINSVSKYVRWVADCDTSWAEHEADQFDAADTTPYYYSFAGGADGSDAALGDYETGFDLFKNQTQYGALLVICPPLDETDITYVLAQYLIDEIVEPRLDSIAFISPAKEGVVSSATPLADVLAFKTSLARNSSYAVLDCNWKKMYDKYNDVYIWVPLSGDIAGLCARTDSVRDPWWSPAGFDRGRIKNAVKLAWNPSEADRDSMYPVGINPVVSFADVGIVLYGDKTLLSKPSAFDRINVRRLFITIEKAISTAAKYMLFEFNDEPTRNQFKSMVEPYLKEVKGRRGIYDFLFVCDETNNTGEVIDRNELVADIYIKPTKSTNYIQLNFVAVRTGVSFSEVAGKF